MNETPPKSDWASAGRVLLAAAGVVALVWGSNQRAKVLAEKRKRLGHGQRPPT